MSRARLAMVLLGLAIALGIVAPALAATPKTTITDIEGEVMCPICGTLLELSNSPQGQRERAFVARLIGEGKTKAEIKSALVTEYGPDVLAVPEGSGFDLTAYLIPVIAFVAAALALAVGVRRWRRAADRPGSKPQAASGPEGEDAKRLEADLARYDL